MFFIFFFINKKKIFFKILFLLIHIFLLLDENIYFLLNDIKLNYKIKGIKFLNKCFQNSLKKNIIKKNNKINKNINEIKICPKISVIIPVYNCEKSIKITIKSIQYQNMNDYEIILVNDCSKDNSLKIIKNLQQFDKRIKIVNNIKNMGTLYSRSIGVLKSKGKYIFALDNDDVFLNENILEKIVRIAENKNFDIVEFKSFNIPNYYPKINQIKDGDFTYHPNNLILKQPKLGIFPISNNNRYKAKDHFIWGKCIKSYIYKKSIHLLGYKRFSIYNIWTEDISIVIIIFNIAESYIFLNVYGIFHLKSKNTTTHKISKNHRLISRIYLIDILIDFLKNNYESKKYAVYLARKINKKNIELLNNKQKLYFKNVLKKIIKSKYITKKNKIIIQKEFFK